MRVGSNPNKGKGASYLTKETVCVVVTHLPNLKGYHSQRWEVVTTCLNSMRNGIHSDHTFMIWDNGSMPEFQDWLKKSFSPDFLILSPNVGKKNALASIVRMLPVHSIMCYSDDDMLFLDNWYAPQKEILDHFPNVSSVTGYPVRTAFRWGVANTLQWAKQNGKLEAGRFLPQQWENDFAVSIGRDVEWHAYYSLQDIDYRVTYKGKQAYCTSHHCQFIGHVHKLQQALFPDNLALGDERAADILLDEIGLRLATTQRLARHIGNVIDDSIRQEMMVMANA